MRKVAIFCFLLVCSLQGLGQFQSYTIRNYKAIDGLPQSQVYDIVQSNRGNLWLATLGGVSRFDGASFRNFTKSEGLSSNSIKTVYQDKAGRMWFGSASRFDVRGVCVFASCCQTANPATS